MLRSKMKRELTNKQREVLQLTALGLVCKEIGDKIGVKDVAVRRYLDIVRTKLMARTTANAVYIAVKRGIIS